MDLTWSTEEEAFRAEARGWLETNLAAWHEEVGGDAGLGRHPRRVRAAPGVGATAVRRPMGRGLLAGGARRTGGIALGVAPLRGGVLPRRRAAPGHAERDLPARAEPVRVRHARPADRHPPPHGRRRRPLVPRLVGAERRQRPGERHEQGAAGRRGLGARRPEDVDHPGCVLHPPVRALPHRPRERSAQGPLLPAHPARHPRGHRARLRPTRRRRGVRRGLLRRTRSSPTTPSPAGSCSGSPREDGPSRWPPPAPSAG